MTRPTVFCAAVSRALDTSRGDDGLTKPLDFIGAPLSDAQMPVRHSTSALSTLLAAGVAILSVTAFGQAGRSSSSLGDMLVDFGTYTGEKSKGVYVRASISPLER